MNLIFRKIKTQMDNQKGKAQEDQKNLSLECQLRHDYHKSWSIVIQGILSPKEDSFHSVSLEKSAYIFCLFQELLLRFGPVGIKITENIHMPSIVVTDLGRCLEFSICPEDLKDFI